MPTNKHLPHKLIVHCVTASHEALADLANKNGSEYYEKKVKNTAGLTSGHRSNQDSVEFDDGAEDVLGISNAGQILAMKLEDQTLVLFLQ